MLAPVACPATTAKQIMRTFDAMQVARRPKASRPYRRFKRFSSPQRAIAIPVPKNQTLAVGVEERRNVVAIWRRPSMKIAVADTA